MCILLSNQEQLINKITWLDILGVHLCIPPQRAFSKFWLQTVVVQGFWVIPSLHHSFMCRKTKKKNNLDVIVEDKMRLVVLLKQTESVLVCKILKLRSTPITTCQFPSSTRASPHVLWVNSKWINNKGFNSCQQTASNDEKVVAADEQDTTSMAP